jgi:ABC-2 type transport system permease protein
MLQRVFAIIQKEFAQALRDRPTMAIMLSMPLLLLILFGYAITTQVRHIPTVVADQSLDAYSRAYLEDMVNSQYFDLVITVPDPGSVRQEMDAGRARAGIVILPNFGEHIQRGDAQVLVMVDGSDLFTSQAAYSAANLVGQNHAARIVMQNIAASGSAADTQSLPNLLAHIRILYNPDLIDLWFIIPGIAAMLLQTQTIVLTAAAVVREREMGTIEQILVTPIRPLELMLGKIVPYLCVAIFNTLTIIGLAVYLFKVPFQGDIWLFLGLTFLYVFSGLGLGLLISTVSRNQREAQQLIMLIMTTGLILGGFIFPRYTMPGVIQALGNLFPLTYFIPISRGIITRGVGFEVVAGEVLALVAYIIVVLFLATRAFRERLE